ncbi:hypothetical protein [Pseudomonas serbica]|uniref:hypothetical protein n=1 Tax=Pseudomonas serbica TaxID=2965074 RepID=UPI00237AF2D3|nr:hypothetical protein [Pseudomonas serbica]
MSIFELPELKAYEHFEAFHKALYRMKVKGADPIEVDMLLATFPEALKGQALLHAYARAIHFFSANILDYVQGKGIDELYPDLYQDLEVADRIRRRVFDNQKGALSSPGHIKILRKAAAHHGKAYTMDSVDTIFNSYDAGDKSIGFKIDKGSDAMLTGAVTSLEYLRLFCAQDTVDDPEVGNQVAYRFAETISSLGIDKASEFELLKTVSTFNINDVGSMTLMLGRGFHPGLEPLNPHLDAAIKTVVNLPFKQESLRFITAVLKVRPATVLSELMALPDESFFKQVRGRFMDQYLTSNWMVPLAKNGHDYDDPVYLALVDSFNERILSDRFVVKYITNHQGIAAPGCQGMVTLMLSSRLKEQGVTLSVHNNAQQTDRFAALVKFAADYPLLASYREHGVELLKEGVKPALVKLYDEFYEQADKKYMKAPDKVTDDFKVNHMAARLACESAIHEDDWHQSKMKAITPVLFFCHNHLPGRSLGVPGTLKVITRSLSEDDLLEAVGKRPDLLRYLINEAVLKKEHMAKLPLPMLGQEFGKDLGL